ncbi:hypothetical protein T492DRAFT_234178 [Pavlovales sp. CCMP2436]|nr:hypothetical protein T492DRAFT_234178 [Pavlovales sp. CCMP2436]
MVRTIEELGKLAPPSMFNVTPGSPLERYLGAARLLCDAGYDRYEQGDNEDAYIFLLRFATLILSEMPRHPDWRTPKSAHQRDQRQRFTIQAMTAVEFLEKVKHELLDVQQTGEVIRRREAHVTALAREVEAQRQLEREVAAEAEAARRAAAAAAQAAQQSHLLAILQQSQAQSQHGRPTSLYPSVSAPRASLAPSYSAFMPPRQNYARPTPQPAAATATAATQPADGVLISTEPESESAAVNAKPTASDELIRAFAEPPPEPEASARPTVADSGDGPGEVAKPDAFAVGRLLADGDAPPVPRDAPPVPGDAPATERGGAGREADGGARAEREEWPNEERPRASFAIDTVPLGPIHSGSSEPPRDVHRVGAPPPPKLSDRPAPTTQDQRTRLQVLWEVAYIISAVGGCAQPS